MTSVIANLRQRLVAPTLDAAAAAMLDNGYLVTATRALPAVPHIDLETPPGEDDDVSERTTDVSKGDAGSGRRGSGDLGGLGSERNGKGAEETEDGVPNGTARGGGQNKEREGVLRKARKLSANKTFVQELRSGTGAVPTGLYGTSSGKPSSSRNGTEELPGKADVRGLVRRRMSADAAMVNRNVTVESLERATRILPRGSRQIGADRGSELERAALTERGRRDTVRVAELGGKGNGTGNGNGNGVRMESDVSVGRHKTGWGDRRAPKAVWLEEPRGTDSRMKGTAGEVRTTGPKGADVSVAEGKVGDKEKEVSSNVSEAARPAKEALELFYKMFPESAVDERADSAGKENVVGGTAKRERHSWKEARSEATAVGSQVFAHRTARSAPAADYTRKSMPESIPEEKRVEKETTRQGRPFESKFAVPSERLKTGSGEKDRPLKLPLIPLTPTGQVQKSGRTKW